MLSSEKRAGQLPTAAVTAVAINDNEAFLKTDVLGWRIVEVDSGTKKAMQRWIVKLVGAVIPTNSPSPPRFVTPPVASKQKDSSLIAEHWKAHWPEIILGGGFVVAGMWVFVFGQFPYHYFLGLGLILTGVIAIVAGESPRGGGGGGAAGL